MDEKDRVSKVRISRERGFAPAPEVSRTLSKNADALCQSRKFFQTASANVAANFLQHAAQPARLGEIFINLVAPCSVVALANKRRKLSQFFCRKLIDCSFNFGQAHASKIIDSDHECNARGLPRPSRRAREFTGCYD